MAAHDDKISNNRRRLFKALSMAPVVATLRPGEALASQSAFQCLEGLRSQAFDPASGDFGPFASATGNDLIADENSHWVWQWINGAPVDGVDCGGTIFPSTGFVVKFGPNYFDQDSNQVLGAEKSGKKLQFKNSDDVICFEISDGQQGFFAKVVRSSPDDTEIQRILNQPYPKQPVDIGSPDNPTPPGSNQVISCTCMNSLMPGSCTLTGG